MTLQIVTQTLRFYVTVCGGLCRGRWINSYIKWQEENDNA